VTNVLVIGVDGFDREVVERFLVRMPNLSSLMARGTMMPYSAVFPPDSPTCWASIYTGLNPARHGVGLSAVADPGRDGRQDDGDGYPRVWPRNLST
jgi:predicted AlkP superfamily phosphohydrolase/phosphomutase